LRELSIVCAQSIEPGTWTAVYGKGSLAAIIDPMCFGIDLNDRDILQDATMAWRQAKGKMSGLFDGIIVLISVSDVKGVYLREVEGAPAGQN
jgi:hypothetical protein